MTQKKHDVVVVIPAYNEEEVILRLVREVKLQTTASFNLEKIVVVSDGSTDKTVEVIKKMKDKKVEVWHDKKRLGKAGRLNQVFKKLNTEILIIIDADVKLANNEVLENLVKEFDRNNIQLVSGQIRPDKPKNILQKALVSGANMMREIVETGNLEMYKCTGALRAFNKSFYKNIQFPAVFAEDVYPYLVCKQRNLGFAVTDKSLVYYQMPLTLKSYIKQMKRYLGARKNLESVFDKDMLKKEFYISPVIKVRVVILRLIKDPVFTSLYLIITTIPKFFSSARVREKGGLWQRTR